MATKKPNILILWGDDIGYWNISHYSKGMMGYHTPNIDRIAQEGATFTDWYGQQSCTAGRAAFITGELPIRTGMWFCRRFGSFQSQASLPTCFSSSVQASLPTLPRHSW
jgi:arylsulfatase A-like enzyme